MATLVTAATHFPRKKSKSLSSLNSTVIEEVAEVAMHGDDEIGEPARADGTIEVSWDVQDE